jgi:soluble lytic murein transglycosylase-like protein
MSKQRLKQLQRRSRPWSLPAVLCAALLLGGILIVFAAQSRTRDRAAGRNTVGSLDAQMLANNRSPSELIRSICPQLTETAEEQRAISEILEVTGESTIDFRIEAELLFAVMAAESRCKSSARSQAGALGIMQLAPRTARSLGVTDSESVRENIRAGAQYLRVMLTRFDGDLRLALAAYNAGPSVVVRYKGIPPYPETEVFVNRVLSYYQKLRA